MMMMTRGHQSQVSIVKDENDASSGFGNVGLSSTPGTAWTCWTRPPISSKPFGLQAGWHGGCSLAMAQVEGRGLDRSWGDEAKDCIMFLRSAAVLSFGLAEFCVQTSCSAGREMVDGWMDGCVWIMAERFGRAAAASTATMRTSVHTYICCCRRCGILSCRGSRHRLLAPRYCNSDGFIDRRHASLSNRSLATYFRRGPLPEIC